MGVLDLSLLEVADALAKRQLGAVELVKECLAHSARVDPAIRAYVRIDEQRALSAAKASDERRAANRSLGPLDGVPLGLKDNILTEGLETTAGSRILKGFVPPHDATVARQLREAGAVIAGKFNLDEFAMGSSTETSIYGSTTNPFDATRTPGGSSGGSAAGVASKQVFGALGSDTGGSIRQPAAFTNTVGLKPTYGRVSRSGVVAFASSLDQVGPLTRSVRDAAVMLQAIAKFDPADSTSDRRAAPDYLAGIEDGVKGLKIGLPREWFVEGMDGEIVSAVRAAAKRFEALGATIVDVSLPMTKYALAVYYVIAPCEASSNLARYDGVRFGHRAADAKSLRELYARSRSEGFGAEVKRRIMLGTFALSSGYYDAYYGRAQRVRTRITQDFERVFGEVDVLLSATSPVLPWKLGEKLDDPLAMYLMDVLTLPCNLAGLPGLSVPCGFAQSGLPIGLQLVGRRWEEATLLRAARTFERDREGADASR